MAAQFHGPRRRRTAASLSFCAPFLTAGGRSNVLCYEGVLLSRKEGEAQEERYERRGDCNSYTYWFKAHLPMPTVVCLDATASVHISKFINHSRKRPNIVPKLFMVDGKPRLMFVSKVEIEPGTELLFDYGDKRPAVVAVHPWLLE